MALGRKTGGRRPGSLNESTKRRLRLLEAINEDDRKIIEGVIRDAKAGDHGARQLYFRYLRPAPPQEIFLAAFHYAVPESVEVARNTILALGARLAEGEISLEAHNALVDNLRAFLADKAAEQQRLLETLEADHELRNPRRTP
jgi:hypothetical protein